MCACYERSALFAPLHCFTHTHTHSQVLSSSKRILSFPMLAHSSSCSLFPLYFLSTPLFCSLLVLQPSPMTPCTQSLDLPLSVSVVCFSAKRETPAKIQSPIPQVQCPPLPISNLPIRMQRKLTNRRPKRHLRTKRRQRRRGNIG